MQVILQGSLRPFPPAELLSFVCRRTERGTVDFEASGRRSRVLFHGTAIVWAEGTRPADPAETVLDTLAWTDGTFTVLDDAVLPEGAVAVALPLDGLLEEAKRRAEQPARYRDATMFRVVDDFAAQQQVSLTADQFKLLFRVGAGRSFRDLLADLGLQRPELAERLALLEQVGLIAVAVDEPPPPPDADATVRPKKTFTRKRTLVGSLTPDGAPDSVWPLLDSEYTIGRASANAIAIQDGSVSSNHARILRTDEGFVLEDLQSRNGSFVNGEKVEGKRLLADGDLIRLGKVILTFNVARETKAGEQTQPEVRLG